MGFGKKFRKKWKKTFGGFEKKVSHSLNKTFGDIAYDAVKGTVNSAFSLGQTFYDTVEGESLKDSAKKRIVEDSILTVSGTTRKAKELAGETAQAARDAETKANEAAMQKKKALIAEAESSKAEAIDKTYLGTDGTSNAYVDDKEKQKKKLGGKK